MSSYVKMTGVTVENIAPPMKLYPQYVLAKAIHNGVDLFIRTFEYTQCS